jgi:hypothetical protein
MQVLRIRIPGAPERPGASSREDHAINCRMYCYHNDVRGLAAICATKLPTRREKLFTNVLNQQPHFRKRVLLLKFGSILTALISGCNSNIEIDLRYHADGIGPSSGPKP